MEPTSPASAGAEPETGKSKSGRASKPCHVPVKKVAAADAHAPDVTLPLRFIITGIAMFVLGTAALNFYPELLTTYHYNQQIIAFTHLFVLGWITSVVLGAIYQLVPVALETRLHSERLGKVHFVLHVIGFPGMVAMFWVWNPKQVGHFGSFFGFGVGLLAWNLFKTLKNLPKWNEVAFGVVSATFWLVVTAFLGLFLAATKCWELAWFDPIAQMHAHAHAGILGSFLLLIVGVSYRLLPMFTLGEVQSRRRAWSSLILLNLGTAAILFSMLFAPRLKPAAGLLTLAGLFVYGVEVSAIIRTRKRRGMDGAIRTFIGALGLLTLTALTGLALSLPGLPATIFWTQLENAYGLIAILGVVSLALMGMLYKIVPFLVWYATYSKWIGKAKLPSLSDLYSGRILGVSHGAYASGVVVTLVGVLLTSTTTVHAGVALLTVGVLGLAWNMGLILGHLRQAKPASLSSSTSIPSPGTATQPSSPPSYESV